jgi:uncharacterized protein with GYD domain
MATYITLYKWTEHGIKNIKGVPDRIRASIKAGEAAGGKSLGVYITMGEYDLVAVSECPNDEAAAAFVLAQASQGFVQTRTLRAFTPTEFAEILKRMA